MSCYKKTNNKKWCLNLQLRSFSRKGQQSSFEFIVTAELKKWRRIFYRLSLHLKKYKIYSQIPTRKRPVYYSVYCVYVFEERGKVEYFEKKLSEQGENQQQTQSKIYVKCEK